MQTLNKVCRQEQNGKEIQSSSGSWEEAFFFSVEVWGLVGLVTTARWKEFKQSMTWVCGVLADAGSCPEA